jgi:RNA polymerase sigma factor (sigma-70 family)
MLYNKYYGFCLKTTFRYVDSYEQAVEVTNDGFIKIFKHFARFEIRDKGKAEILLMAWMRRIVANSAIDYMRKESHNPDKCQIPESVWEHGDERQLSDSRVLYKELICLVKKLPPAYRLVFNLHVIEGYSHQEIAKMVGITVGTSKSNLSKARAHLQKALLKENTENILCQT